MEWTFRIFAILVILITLLALLLGPEATHDLLMEYWHWGAFGIP